MTLDQYRAAVLVELKDRKRYPNFHGTVRAFIELKALDDLSRAMLSLIKAAHQIDMEIPALAEKIDKLTKTELMTGMLYNAEVKLDKGGQDD